MNKVLFSIIVSCAFALGSSAQIHISKSDVDKPIELTTLSLSWSWLYQSGDFYYMVMKSDNQFDDYYWMNLGKTKDACIVSLTSLLDLTDTIEESDRYDIDNGVGDVFNVTLYSALGMRGLRFHGEGYAGTAYILQSNLKKAIKWIRKNLR